MAITRRTLRLERQIEDALDRVLDAQTRDFVRAWAIAWDEVVPDLRDTLADLLVAGDTITRAEMRRSQRLRKALLLISDQVQALARQAGVRITDDLQAVIDAAGGAQASIIDSQLPPNADQLVDLEAWSRVDARQITAIVERTTERITSRTRALSDDAQDAVRRELIRGVVVGSNPRATARRIIERTEGAFNGGLSRAMTISRTETVDAHRRAGAIGQAQHDDVLIGWEWLAHLTPRTCRSCWSMHGRIFPLSEPGPLDHQQGRCGRMPKTKPWADLGFDVDEPDDLTPDADADFAALTPAQKRAVLGADGYQAWLAGDFPREEWAKRREADGWRDSFVPAKPGDPHAAGYGAQPPGTPPAPPAGAAGDDLPPIGPVLGDALQRAYVRDGERLPLPHDELGRPRLPDEDNANFHHVYVAHRGDRATALLQYDAKGNRLVRATARAIADGDDPGLDDDPMVDLLIRSLWAQRSGITRENYTRDDLVTDIIAAAHWLLAQPVEDLGTLRRGLRLDTIDPLDADAGDRAVAALNLTGWWFVSATPDDTLATAYAGSTSGTSVVLTIRDARGVQLTSMGRMARTVEALLSGDVEVVQWRQVGTTVEVEVRWLT